MDFEIKYSNRRKTLGIIVERDGKVIVTAPEGTPATKITEIVAQKREWIESKKADARKYPSELTRKEFVTGETILYLGHPCVLSISEINFPGIHYDGGVFSISRHSQDKAYELLRAWYKHQTLQVVEPIAKQFAQSLGVVYSGCKVAEMKYRWASCTPKGNLCFNWRIVKAPVNVIRYLVVHELAHLIEPNHTPAFWNIVAIQVPTYAEAKEWLKNNGSEIEIDF